MSFYFQSDGEQQKENELNDEDANSVSFQKKLFFEKQRKIFQKKIKRRANSAVPTMRSIELTIENCWKNSKPNPTPKSTPDHPQSLPQPCTTRQYPRPSKPFALKSKLFGVSFYHFYFLIIFDQFFYQKVSFFKIIFYHRIIYIRW